MGSRVFFIKAISNPMAEYVVKNHTYFNKDLYSVYKTISHTSTDLSVGLY